MKSRQSLLFLSVAFFFVLVAGANPYSPKGKMALCILGYDNTAHSFYLQSDTTPKKENATIDIIKESGTDAAKKISENILKQKGIDFQLPKEDPKKKKLLEKIASLFKFRKNSQKKEEDRITGVINKLKIRDTIVEATASLQKEITRLISDLSEKEKADFDSLLSIIAKLRSDTSYRNDFRNFINTINEKIDGDTSKSPPPFISGSFVTDKDILDATGNFIPLLEQKNQEAAKAKAKREALAALSRLTVRNSDTCHVLSEDKKSIKVYKLSVRTKAEVIGLHNYTLNNDIEEYKYNYLNTLIYQSLFINESNGSFKSLNGWDTAEVISRAKAKNLKVMFTASVGSRLATSFILRDPKVQIQIANNIVAAIKMRQADGVNISFTHCSPSESEQFTDFIERLHAILQESNSSYQLLITVPAYNQSEIFDIKSLNGFADRFLIDFTSTPSSAGALAPLSGPSDYTIENSIAYYTSTMDVPVNKIVTILPYSGIRWQVRQKKLSTQLSLMTYQEIRNTYKNIPVYYDTESGNAVIDALENKNRTVRVIYDDQNSLEKKYDYVLESGLRGIAINALAYDKGYGELWDMLAYKFAIIDSSFVSDSLIAVPVNLQLSWLEKIQRRLSLYWYIVNNPCKVCFDDTQDPKYGATLNRYLQELKIDSLIDAENRLLPPAERYKSRFEYINYELTNLLIASSIILFILLLLATGFYIYQIKVNSTEWKWKKKMEIVLLGITIVFVISFFSYLFCDDTIPLFGSAPAVGTNRHEVVTNTTANTTATYSSVCDTDTNDTCINMPLYTLMGIILAGMLAGFAITRYLILPLIKRDDIP